jgi:N-acetylglutamate synthase-like GNAT family acetyltransferase
MDTMDAANNENAFGETMITVERLPAEEYDALLSVEEGYRPDPEKSITVVAKHDGVVVGRMMLLNLAHVEAAWINESFRSRSLLERMTKEIEKQAAAVGVKTLLVYSETYEMDSYIERLGYTRSPLRVFRKEL